MTSPRDVIEELENRLWQSLVDNDTGTATELLTEPALMVSGCGTFRK